MSATNWNQNNRPADPAVGTVATVAPPAPLQPSAPPPTGPPVSGPRPPSAPNPMVDPTTPLHPPRLPRPDNAAPGGYWASPATTPPVSTQDRPVPPAPVLKPARGWGWRALAAFVAGGLLTGGGFAAARATATDEAATTGTTTAVVEPVGSQESSSTTPALPAPVDPDQEPAAYVAQVLGPSVVQIETDLGSGSGVIYDDNLIMTNSHVIQGASIITVILADGRHVRATLEGADANVDIAVLSVESGLGLTPATLATGEKIQVGQKAIAIGAPFALQQTVTEGIVSALDRPVPSGQIYVAMIQTDAPINPGNSGGALADRQGRVIGINTAIQTDGASTTNAGIGFAIPIDMALNVAERLVAGLPVESGLLGVEGTAPADGAAGVEITSVTPGTAAEAAGLLVGDRIVSFDGAPVTQFAELAGLVVAHQPGDVVELEIVRGQESLTVQATLGRR